MVKMRLDAFLLEQGYFPSREKARSAIMEGRILVNERKVEKAGFPVTEDVSIRVLGDDLPYVSRGGLKLEKAIMVFKIDLTNCIIADIGASTGGFTHCALENGANKVYAVDVGYGQLAWSLRQDPRVIVLEKTNARYLTKDQIVDALDYVTMDVSFISLRKIIPTLLPLLKETGKIIALIKPQFEAGKEKIGKNGVVRDPKIHQEVIENILDFAATFDLSVEGIDYSPITGPKGNIEYLILLAKNGVSVTVEVEKLINEAFLHLYNQKNV